jgi:tetratricopeptide (TPR) repeat protein
VDWSIYTQRIYATETSNQKMVETSNANSLIYSVLFVFGDVPVFKLADFGISCVVVPTASGKENITQSLRGTIGYIAPEILKRSRFKRSTDIWGLGATLTYIAAGPEGIARWLLAGQTANPLLPKHYTYLYHLLECTLQQDPDSRPAACEILTILLKQHLRYSNVIHEYQCLKYERGQDIWDNELNQDNLTDGPAFDGYFRDPGRPDGIMRVIHFEKHCMALGETFQNADIVASIERHRECIARYPSHSLYHRRRLVLLYMQKHNWIEAIKTLEDLLRVDLPSVAFYQTKLEFNYLQLGKSRISSGNADQAIFLWKQAVIKDRCRTDLPSQLTHAFKVYQSIDEALEFWEQTLISEPRESIFVVELASAYEEKSHIDRAIVFWENIVKENLEQISLVQQLAKSYKKKGDFERAIKFCEGALAQRPDNVALSLVLQEFLTLNTHVQYILLCVSHSRTWCKVPVTIQGGRMEEDSEVLKKLNEAFWKELYPSAWARAFWRSRVGRLLTSKKILSIDLVDVLIRSC